MLVYLATQNRGKLDEILSIADEIKPVATGGLQLKSLQDLPLRTSTDYQPIENGSSFLENARIKAKALFDIVKCPVLAEDSGLEVDLLNGKPGIHSSRYGKDDDERIDRLLSELKAVVPSGQQFLSDATFTACVCLLDAAGNSSFFFGRVRGKIISAPGGTAGFGYDPVFYYTPASMTFAQMDKEQKNRISHRRVAFEQALRFLSNSAVE